MESEKVGENIVDLRDLEDEERELWKTAIEEETGYDFDQVVENAYTMIADNYFTEYAQEEAEGLGLIGSNMGWPCNHIDWGAAAEELQMDYTLFEVDGVRYWFRSF